MVIMIGQWRHVSTMNKTSTRELERAHDNSFATRILPGCGQSQPIQNAHDNSFATGILLGCGHDNYMTIHMTNPHDNSFATGIPIVMWGSHAFQRFEISRISKF